MAKAHFGDTVKIRLTFRLDEACTIEAARSGETRIVTIGKGNLGARAELALVGMNVGEKKSVSVLSSKEFGFSANVVHGRKQTLDIELLEIMKTANIVESFEKTEGMISLEEALLLYDLAKNTREGCIVEVGSYRGRSTVALGLGSLNGHQVPVYAIEPHEEFIGILGGVFGPQDRGAFFQAMLDTMCYLIVRLINLSSERVAPLWNRKIGLLWIDGDHSYEGVKRDFDCWSPHLAAGAVVAFDDATDPRLGPYRLIHELLRDGFLYRVQVTGKIAVLKMRSYREY